MKRTALRFAAWGAVALLASMLAGGVVAQWVFLLVSLAFPVALIAMGTAGTRRRGLRVALLVLLLLLEASGIAVLALSGRSELRLLGLPIATIVALCGLGLLPLAWVSASFVLTFDEDPTGGAGDSRVEVDR